VSYRILYTPAADRQFRRLPRDIMTRVAWRIDALATNPRPHGVKRLTDGFYRLRVGSYRVIYNIVDGDQLIEVLIVKHRREAY